MKGFEEERIERETERGEGRSGRRMEMGRGRNRAEGEEGREGSREGEEGEGEREGRGREEGREMSCVYSTPVQCLHR